MSCPPCPAPAPLSLVALGLGRKAMARTPSNGKTQASCSKGMSVSRRGACSCTSIMSWHVLFSSLLSRSRDIGSSPPSGTPSPGGRAARQLGSEAGFLPFVAARHGLTSGRGDAAGGLRQRRPRRCRLRIRHHLQDLPAWQAAARATTRQTACLRRWALLVPSPLPSSRVVKTRYCRL